LGLGQDLPLVKISCKSMHSFLHEAAHRRTERTTDKPTWSHNLRLGGVKDTDATVETNCLPFHNTEWSRKIVDPHCSL